MMASKTERLNLRLTPAQDEVLRRAADARGEAVSDYVLRHAVEAAEMDLADRRVFVLDDAAWERLQEALTRPPRPASRLRQLLSQPSVLEEK
jgi:uncharacterized protein (DUF1778 family)